MATDVTGIQSGGLGNSLHGTIYSLGAERLSENLATLGHAPEE
jgi:hypothetical protein